MTTEKRLPSKVVSVLLRLERAGDEHSKTTERLCDAAWLVADLIRQQWRGHVSPLAGEDCTCQTRTGISADGRGVTIWSSSDRGVVIAPDGHPGRPCRWAAIRLAEAVADGWLDELAAWVEARAAEDVAATAVLEAAADRLQPEVSGQEYVRSVWEAQDTPIWRVLDEDGDNMANAQVRETADHRWLYVDDTDGWHEVSPDNAQSMLTHAVPDGWERQQPEGVE